MEFPRPEPLDIDEDTRTEIATQCCQVYDKRVQARAAGGHTGKHLRYEQMFRGELPPRPNPPWPGAADLHVQMPYWLVDAVSVRMTAAIWGQKPLINAIPYEDDDVEAGRDAATLVEWHCSPERMNARMIDHRLGKMRLIHGQATGLLSYVTEERTFRVVTHVEDELLLDPMTKLPQVDDQTGDVIKRPKSITEPRTVTYYSGPVLTPLNYDDIQDPMDCMNLQPQTPSNPQGAEDVIVRQWESLSLMLKKADSGYDLLLDDQYTDRDWWRGQAPSQDRSSNTASSSNQRRSRQQDRQDGLSRTNEAHTRQAENSNPQFEILTWFTPWEDPETGQIEEMVFFVCQQPQLTLGGYRLADLHFTGKRPLYEKHYQTVSNRRQSMGLMEIVQHLSAELDTIHNMRIDIGFATNMPYYFYRDSMGYEPDEVEIRPLKGIPVSDPSGIVFPNTQGQTTFYIQEENLLYTLVERVVGVTDLFLGMSPTQGAAARHATGFVGTQQESLARTSEVIHQDAVSAGWLFGFIYEMELQYGPPQRAFRLFGRDSQVAQRITKMQIRMNGSYDFMLAANQGSYSQQVEQQKGDAVMQLKGTSQFMNQDPAKAWEAERYWLETRQFDAQTIDRFIGPRGSLGMTTPKEQDEEIGEMMQYKYGVDQPAPVHPNDDDTKHLQAIQQWLTSPEFIAMERANETGLTLHAQMHVQQMQSKRQQMQAQASAAAQAPLSPLSAPGSQGAPPAPSDGALPAMLAQSPGTPPDGGGQMAVNGGVPNG